MSDIYCGSKKDIPKGKKRGSMKQCAELGEVRYYGIKKIDQKLVDAVDDAKKKNTSATNKLASKKKSLEENYIKLIGKIKKVKDKLAVEKDKMAKLVLQKELESFETKQREIKIELSILQKPKAKSKSKSARAKPKKVKSKKLKSKSKTKKTKTKSKK